MYKIENVSDMTIAGIKPGSHKKLKELSPKHIKYHNEGLLNITQEQDKPAAVVKEKATVNTTSKSEQKDEVE